MNPFNSMWHLQLLSNKLSIHPSQYVFLVFLLCLQAAETSSRSWTAPCRTSAISTCCWRRPRSRRWGRHWWRRGVASAASSPCCGPSWSVFLISSFLKRQTNDLLGSGLSQLLRIQTMRQTIIGEFKVWKFVSVANFTRSTESFIYPVTGEAINISSFIICNIKKMWYTWSAVHEIKHIKQKKQETFFQRPNIHWWTFLLLLVIYKMNITLTFSDLQSQKLSTKENNGRF